MSGKPDLRDALRQMVAVLENERQALAGMKLDGILGAAADKQVLCNQLRDAAHGAVDAECRGLLDAAKRLNEVNRQLRNLIAANVAARLEAIAGQTAPHRAGAAIPRTAAYAYAGARR